MSSNKAYSIEFLDTGVVKEFNTLTQSAKAQIQKAIEERIMVNPVAFGKPLRFTLKGYRRLRVGRYRIIYRIEEAHKNVVVVAIKHRKDIYKNSSVL